MAQGKTMQPLLVGGEQVYVDLNCGFALTAWDAAATAAHGPIEQQGCDWCESSIARWTKVWVEQ